MPKVKTLLVPTSRMGFPNGALSWGNPKGTQGPPGFQKKG
jgi:hypothetical protein